MDGNTIKDNMKERNRIVFRSFILSLILLPSNFDEVQIDRQ